MAGPNFFVIGAPKAATTALYHALREHPSVFLPDVKEPHLYAYLADRSAAGHLYADAASARRRYAELYAPVRDETAVGDASTTNLVVPGAAAAIAADVPAARIVAILRHPVERAFSHWAHFRAAGGEPIADFAEAVRQERPRQEAGFPFTYRYLAWGRYSTQLPPFFERFGRDRVLVHLYEDVCADPAAVVRATLAFLDLDASGSLPRVERHNEMPVPRIPALQRALDGRGRAGRVVRRVLPPKARAPLRAWSADHLRRRLTIDPALRAELTAGFADEIGRLEALIDRDLSAWRS
jgi:hypothetical protein